MRSDVSPFSGFSSSGCSRVGPSGTRGNSTVASNPLLRAISAAAGSLVGWSGECMPSPGSSIGGPSSLPVASTCSTNGPNSSPSQNVPSNSTMLSTSKSWPVSSRPLRTSSGTGTSLPGYVLPSATIGHFTWRSGSRRRKATSALTVPSPLPSGVLNAGRHPVDAQEEVGAVRLGPEAVVGEREVLARLARRKDVADALDRLPVEGRAPAVDGDGVLDELPAPRAGGERVRRQRGEADERRALLRCGYRPERRRTTGNQDPQASSCLHRRVRRVEVPADRPGTFDRSSPDLEFYIDRRRPEWHARINGPSPACQPDAGCVRAAGLARRLPEFGWREPKGANVCDALLRV